jgi:signal transduction histidine kinase
MNPLLAQLTHRPFPDVAEILRNDADQITHEWDAAVRKAMPQMQHLTYDELKDSTPQILLAISHALASDDPEVIRELVNRAPSQGLSRLKLNFDVVEVMQEDRLLRAITVHHVENKLRRRMDVLESAALHAAIDVMLQRSVIALVDEQKMKLRAAAETEMKFLSFLSHDLNNNLNSVTMSLHALESDLEKAGGFAEAMESLVRARKTIFDTVAGMRQMLEHERLRNTSKAPRFLPVDLHVVAMSIAAQMSGQAAAKGTKVIIDIPPDTVVESNADLLSLILQNLVGNGVKYSNGGTVRVGLNGDAPPWHRTLYVSDDGPGIAPEKVDHIFQRFTRGDVHGEQGLGLGLAIASQAAQLLGAGLTVESQLGTGSTFHLAMQNNGSIAVKMPKRIGADQCCT